MLSNMNAKELKAFNDAEEIGNLRRMPAFNKIMAVLDAAVDAATTTIKTNHDPRLDTPLRIALQEREAMRTFIHQYIDAVVAQRRDTVRDLLISLGIDIETAERNMDMSLTFLTQHMEATNGKAQL